MAANCIKPNGWWRRGPHYSPAISAGDSPFPSPPAAGVARRPVPALQLITFAEPLPQSIRAAAPQHASAPILQEGAITLLQSRLPAADGGAARRCHSERAGQGGGWGMGAGDGVLLVTWLSGCSERRLVS